MIRTLNYALAFWIAFTTALTPTLASAGMADRVIAEGGNGTLNSPVSALTGAEVKAEKGSSNVSVKASIVSSFTESLVTADSGTAFFAVWSLTASAPLNKNGDASEVANLDGLVNAASIELKFSRFQVPGKRNPVKNRDEMQKLEKDICKRAFEELKRRTGKDPDIPHRHATPISS